MAAYSFQDVTASITGPGGSIRLGYGAGAAEEGIDIVRNAEQDILTMGADGTGMHSKVVDKSAVVTVRLLKTSPQNAQLMAMFDAQSLSSVNWGQNVITVEQKAAGDITACRSCAFRKVPDTKYGKEGGVNEWQFNAAYVDGVFGTY